MRKKGVVLQNDDLLRANKNRQMEEEGSATGLDNALNMLGMEEKEKSKNLKVLFNEFSERETPKISADNPGLKRRRSRSASSGPGRSRRRTRRTNTV